MELAFELVEQPHLTRLDGFRFVHHRLRGAYQPWSRVQALDAVAEALERAELARAGSAFGVYYDLPWSLREPDEWVADLGFPLASEVLLPSRPGLRSRFFPDFRVAALRYRGDLTSFPGALAHLVSWIERKDIDARGPLLERFHVSDALTGEEERDVMVALDAIVP